MKAATFPDNLSSKDEGKTPVVQLKPVPVNEIREANEEAGVILTRLMTRMAPGEHVLRLAVCMEDQDPLYAALAVTVEGKGDSDDMIGTDPVFQDNFRFLLTCGLAQRLSCGVMYMRSPAPAEVAAPYMVNAWELDHGALTSCEAARADELLGSGEDTSAFRDAFSLYNSEDGDGETIYPRAAYTVL
ncbi:hypothetical protein ACFYPT_38530 [Streptomyces sp. NPDC005529]|uniref:hypothetical protein n=1 Tax=unclassified Streptomyces TaxID=2593676 RepID=UPI0033B5E0F8